MIYPLTIISTVLLLLASILGLVYIKQSSRALKTLTLYLCGSFIVQLISIIMANYGVNSLPVLHFFTIYQFVFLSLYFLKVIHSKRIRTAQIYLLIIVPIGLVFNSIFIENLFSFNSLGIFISNSIVLVYIFVFFYQALDSFEKWTSSPTLIINIGLFFYISESMLLFLFGNKLINVSLNKQTILWEINILTHIVFILLILVAQWILYLKKKKALSYQ